MRGISRACDIKRCLPVRLYRLSTSPTCPVESEHLLRSNSAICILSLILTVALPGEILAMPPGGAGDHEKRLALGRLLYEQQCAECHGDDGEDTGRTDGIKTLPGIYIRATDFEIGHRFRGFSASMISEEERDAVVAYVKSLKGKKAYARPEFVISSIALEPFITDPSVRIVDLRSIEEYRLLHLPNAVHLSWEKLRQTTGDVPFSRLMEDIGIGDDTYVVVYDDQSGRRAATLWAALRTHGHPRISILDGGWANWVREKRRVTVWGPPQRSVRFSSESMATAQSEDVHVAAARLVNIDESVSARGQQSQALWRSILQPDGTFQPAKALMDLYQRSGLRMGERVQTISRDPAAAALAMFSLELIGFHGASVSPDISGLVNADRHMVPAMHIPEPEDGHPH
jgi:3-mercaptopyruvate sulfurtransferase SseA